MAIRSSIGAAQEPFWPEGLGINRGFLHVLDCADMVRSYAALAGSGAGCDAANAMIARREMLFKCTKQVSGHNRLTELKPQRTDAKSFTYTIDPATRYRNLPPTLPPAPTFAVLSDPRVTHGGKSQHLPL